MAELSVIIPTLNEEENPYFLKAMNQLSSIRNIEVIVSDGGSTDNTLNIASEFKTTVISNVVSSRAERINLGLAQASAERILLHHPRSIISQEGIESLLGTTCSSSWGGFTHSFDLEHPLLRFTSWYSNNIRGAISGIVYLDHCIFLTREMALTIGKLPAVDIFEDTILSQRLRKSFGAPTILPYKATTSAIRFKTNGVFKQAFMNQILKLKFYLGADHMKMNKYYEKKLPLNSRYKND